MPALRPSHPSPSPRRRSGESGGLGGRESKTAVGSVGERPCGAVKRGVKWRRRRKADKYWRLRLHSRWLTKTPPIDFIPPLARKHNLGSRLCLCPSRLVGFASENNGFFIFLFFGFRIWNLCWPVEMEVSRDRS